MTPKQEETLELICEKTIKYDGKLFEINRFKELHNYIIVYSQQRTFNFLHSEIDEFLDSLEIITDQSLIQEYKIATVKNKQVNNNDNMLDLTNFKATEAQEKVQTALIDALEKVQSDKNYIPQAKAVVDIANTMVNIEKVQLQFIQSVKKLKR